MKSGVSNHGPVGGTRRAAGIGIVQSISHKDPQTTLAVERSEVVDFLETNKIKALVGGKKKKAN
jgi:hypothetical protein